MTTGARRGEPMVRRRGEMLEPWLQEAEDDLLHGKRKPGDPEPVGLFGGLRPLKLRPIFPPTRQDFLDTVARMGGNVAGEAGRPLSATVEPEEETVLFRFAKKLDVVRPEAFVELKVFP